MCETQVPSLSRVDPWRRKWQPTPVLLPGKFHGQRSLAGQTPWGRKDSVMTERLRFFFTRALTQHSPHSYMANRHAPAHRAFPLAGLLSSCPRPGWDSDKDVFSPVCPPALEPACCLPALCLCPGPISWTSASSPSPTPTTTCREPSAQLSSTWGWHVSWTLRVSPARPQPGFPPGGLPNPVLPPNSTATPAQSPRSVLIQLSPSPHLFLITNPTPFRPPIFYFLHLYLFFFFFLAMLWAWLELSSPVRD